MEVLHAILWLGAAASAVTANNISISADGKPFARNGIVYTGLASGVPNGSCEFEVAGILYHTQADRLDGRHYGLVNYNCSNFKGFLVSRFTSCDECYTICTHNEFIENCKSYWFALTVGILTGSAIIWCLVTLFWIVLSKTLKKNKKRMSEKAVRFSSVADLLRPTTSSSFQTSTVILVILFVFPLVSCCDRTLYLSSDNKICEKNLCRDTQSILLTVEQGMTLCLVDKLGHIRRLELRSIRETVSYMPIYYTANFILQSKSMSECKADGSSCWNPETSGTCSDKMIHSPHKDKLLEVQLNGLVHGTTCNVSPLGCNYWCWHKVACTWTIWWLEPILPFAKVYKQQHKLLQAEVVLTAENAISKTVVLSSEEPAVTGIFPINLININTAEVSIHDKLLIVNTKVYPMGGSELNQPLANTLGDYQKQLSGNQSIYPVNNIACKSIGCRAECSGPTSFLERFLKTAPVPISVLNTKSDRIRLINERKGSVTVMLEVANLDHLLVIEPICDVKVIFSQGCSGCTQPTLIVFQTPNIRESGVLHFESDCEFETNLVTCQTVPNTINLFGNPKECSLYFRSINKTLTVSPEYIFTGNLSSIEMWVSESSSDISGTLTMLWNNPNFINGVLSSFTIGSIGIIIINLIMRLLAFIAGRRVAKEVTQ